MLPANNERIKCEMLLLSVREVQGRNGPYCVLELKPGKKERKIEAKVWKMEKEQLTASTPEMTVVSLYLSGNEYRGEMGYIADSVVPGTADPSEYMTTSKIDGGKMYDYIEKLIEKHYADHPAAAAFRHIYMTNEETLKTHPGAMTVHHAYPGGLILHMGTCASLCHKLADVVSPKTVRRIRDMETKDVMNSIYRTAKKADGGQLTKKALEAFRTYSTAVSVAAEEKLLALLVLQKLIGSYPFLDRDLVYAIILLRGVSVFTKDPAYVALIGSRAADAEAAYSIFSEEGTDEEKVRLITHSLLVDAETDRAAAIPEAFIVHYAEKIARHAIAEAGAAQFDPGAMVIAAALHDIGKMQEFTAQALGKTEYAADGNLFGHTYMGIRQTAEAYEATGTDRCEATDKVLHCIAAHHGKKEWGALVDPMMPEAQILADVDYIDSRMDIYEGCLNGLAEGERDDTVRKYIGNVVYKPAAGADA